MISPPRNLDEDFSSAEAFSKKEGDIIYQTVKSAFDNKDRFLEEDFAGTVGKSTDAPFLDQFYNSQALKDKSDFDIRQKIFDHTYPTYFSTIDQKLREDGMQDSYSAIVKFDTPLAANFDDFKAKKEEANAHLNSIEKIKQNYAVNSLERDMWEAYQESYRDRLDIWDDENTSHWDTVNKQNQDEAREKGKKVLAEMGISERNLEKFTGFLEGLENPGTAARKTLAQAEEDIRNELARFDEKVLRQIAPGGDVGKMATHLRETLGDSWTKTVTKAGSYLGDLTEKQINYIATGAAKDLKTLVTEGKAGGDVGKAAESLKSVIQKGTVGGEVGKAGESIKRFVRRPRVGGRAKLRVRKDAKKVLKKIENKVKEVPNLKTVVENATKVPDNLGKVSVPSLFSGASAWSKKLTKAVEKTKDWKIGGTVGKLGEKVKGWF